MRAGACEGRVRAEGEARKSRAILEGYDNGVKASPPRGDREAGVGRVVTEVGEGGYGGLGAVPGAVMAGSGAGENAWTRCQCMLEGRSVGSTREIGGERV